MMNKQNAENLEKAINAGKTPAECNDSNLQPLLEMNELLTKHVYDDQEPRADFKKRLFESIASERAERQNRMKFSRFTLPNFRLTVPQLRWSAAIASLVLFSIILGTSGLFAPNGEYLNKFSRLIIDEAHAQDNFTITATVGDTTGIGSTSGFTITSQLEISLDDLRANLRLSPTTAFNLTAIDAKTFFLEPLTTLETGKVYTVTVDAAYQNTTGQLNARNYSWAFQVKDPFKIVQSLPDDRSSGVPVDTGIEFTFSHQNVEGLAEAFSISPHIDGRFETYGRTVVFVPNSRLQAATIYTVSLTDTVRVKGSDEKLLEPLTFSFETSPYSSNRYLVANETMLEFASGDQIVIPIYANDNEKREITSTVYSFKSVEQFIKSLEAKQKIPVWARASRNQYTVDTTSLTKISTSNPEIEKVNYQRFVPLPDELGAGLYLVELQAGSQVSQVLIQITDLAVYSAVTSTDSIIWVNDTATRKAVPNARITSLDGRLNQTTNAEGIALLDGDQVLKGNINPHNLSEYLTVTSGNKLTVVQLGKSTNYYYSDSTYSTDDHWDYLYTDRSMYLPTDTISFWGFLEPRNGTELNDVRVTLASQNYYNRGNEAVPLYEETLPVSRGSYSGSTSFSRLTPGSYVLTTYHNDVRVSTRYLQITEYNKPAYELSVSSANKAVFANESFTHNITAAFFEGTPVANLNISATSTNKTVTTPTQNLTLDANGLGSLTLATQPRDCSLSKSCEIYTYGNLTVKPTLAEEAEIRASTTQIVFNSRVLADVDVQRAADQKITTSLKTFNVDLNKINDGTGSYYAIDDYRGTVAGGTSIRGQITEISYTKVNEGQVYDFINKVHRPKYSIATNRTIVDTFEGVTAADGSFTFDYQGAEDKSYYVDIIVNDQQGGKYTLTEYAYANSRYSSWNEYDYFSVHRADDDYTYNLGETAKFVFKNNNEPIIPDQDDAFLFFKLRQGLQAYSVTNQPEYAFVFDETSIPNVTVDGAYFNGQSYAVPESYFYTNATAGLDLSGRELTIDIQTDKDVYEPGEDVMLTVRITDASGRPVQSALNVNLVDEAFYALRDEQVNPLETLYIGVASGLINTSKTHKYRSLSMLTGGAEGGGCFLADTKILLEDGSSKAIQDIKAGDRILTKQSELSDKLVGATVKQTFVHEVNEYLILNGEIKVTPEHRMFVNYGWQAIGEAKVGNTLLNTRGELVRINSIEWVREPVTVYNFEVEDLHTYFAEGVYVHNDKGGVREDFADTALFESLTTDANGRATVSFELPDNITTWRVTAQAITTDLYAGSGVTPIRSTKPIFADAVIGSEYLASDKPQIKVRAYGTALTSDSALNFQVSAPSLEIDKSFTEAPYTSSYIGLGDLSNRLGAHDILVSAKSGEYSDVLKRPTSVIESRITTNEESLETLTNDTTLADKSGTELMFSDASRGQYYRDVTNLTYASGGRVDQLAASIISDNLLEEYFSSNASSANDDITAYTTTNGLIALLPYAAGDLALTSKIAAADASLVDAYTLSGTLQRVLDSKQSTNEEIAQALFGLAAIGEPVLIPIQNLARLEEQSVTTQLYTALALAEIGDKEQARDIYLNLLSTYGEETDATARLKLETDAETLEATTLAAIIAAMLEDQKMDGLWAYANSTYVKNIIIPLEKALYLSTVIPNLPVSDNSFDLTIEGRTTSIDLSNGKTYRLRLTNDQAQSADIDKVQGAINLTTSRSVVSDGTTQSDLVAIKREYRDLNQNPVTKFKEGDVVEIVISSSINEKAPSGNYQITDLLPSGLTPVTQPRRSNILPKGSRVMRPFSVEGQTAKFMISKDHNFKTFSYYARVTSIGEFTAEPARIEHLETPSIHSFSTGEIVNITR
jgi:hypothetical protein